MVFPFDLVIFPCLLRTWTTLAVRSPIFGFEQSLPQHRSHYPGFFFFLFWSFLSSFILPEYYIYHTNHGAINPFLDDSLRLILHHLLSFIFYFSLSYLVHKDIPPIIGGVFDSSPRLALPTYLSPFIFSPYIAFLMRYLSHTNYG